MTVCMKCQSLFSPKKVCKISNSGGLIWAYGDKLNEMLHLYSVKNKKNAIHLLSADFAYKCGNKYTSMGNNNVQIVISFLIGDYC